MTLFPPTWVTLHGLHDAGSVDEALAQLTAQGVLPYVGRFSADRTRLYWQEDEYFEAGAEAAADEETAGDAVGPRHRLLMGSRPWSYVRSF